MLTAGSGMIDQTTDSYQRTIDSLASRQATIQARLDRQRESLAARFTAMEAAMSRLQSQSTWLSGQINSLNGLNSSK
jgi:flagellar hook-associated protein 2